MNAYSFIFVSHPGDIESYSLVLGMSIMKYLPEGVSVYYAVPVINNRPWNISAEAVSIFNNLGIKPVYFDNPLLNESNHYERNLLVSNKLFCLVPLAGQENVVFLDSDILCCRPVLFPFTEKDNTSLWAKPADVTIGLNWEEICTRFHLDKPENSITCTYDGKWSPPYFNSGVLIFRKHMLRHFLNTWISLYRELLLYGDRKYAFHFDQVSLSLALLKTGIPYRLLDETFNYPLHLRKKMNDIPVLVHYHHPRFLGKNKHMRKTLTVLFDGNPDIFGWFSSRRWWSKLLRE